MLDLVDSPVNLIMAPINVSRLSLRFASLCMVLFLNACDSNSSQLASAPSQSPEIDWSSMLRSLPGVDTMLPPVVLPADIRSHAKQTGESFEARFALKGAMGQSYSVFLQLDRLKLREDETSKSLWSFDSVARAIVSTGQNNGSALDIRENISRVALGLSESRGDEFIVGNSSLRLGLNDSCMSTIQFSHRDSPTSELELSAESVACPQSMSLGTINQWHFEGIRAGGFIAGEKVDGLLWLTHRWGSSTNLQSAVVLDHLRLVLVGSEGDSHWLTVTRSKRRSGRGPKTLLASIKNSLGETRSVSVEWIDNGEVISPVTGIAYPETVRIQEQSMGVDIELSPIVRLSELRDSLQTRWSGALEVTGSHTGLAYMDFLPLEQN